MSALAEYTGQSKKLRKIACDCLGLENVSLMSDHEVEKWVEENYAVFWGDDNSGYCSRRQNNEIILLIPLEIFNDLREKNEIIFVER